MGQTCFWFYLAHSPFLMVREGVCGTCLPPAVIGPPVGSLPFLSTDAAINNIPVIRGLPAPAVVLKASHRLWAVHSGQCIRYFDVYDQSTGRSNWRERSRLSLGSWFLRISVHHGRGVGQFLLVGMCYGGSTHHREPGCRWG